MPLDGGAVQNVENVENPIQVIADNAVHTVDFLELARSLPHPTIADKNRKRDQGLSLETHRLGLEQFGQNALSFDNRSGVVKCCHALFFRRRHERIRQREQEAGYKIPPIVWCKRGTEAFTKVDGHSLVPGDFIRVQMGDKIPADCRVAKVLTHDDWSTYCLEGNDAFQVDQSSLTGEHEYTTKTGGTSNAQSHGTSLNLEANNLVFLGTICCQGAAELLVIKTGEASLVGALGCLLA